LVLIAQTKYYVMLLCNFNMKRVLAWVQKAIMRRN